MANYSNECLKIFTSILKIIYKGTVHKDYLCYMLLETQQPKQNLVWSIWM